MNDGTECDHLPEPQRRLCRGDIDLSQFRDWMRTGIAPESFRETPIQGTEITLEETAACVHRGEPIPGREIAGLPCHCDKRIFACEIAGPSGCTKSREIVGGMLPSGRVIRRKMILTEDPEIPRMCRTCSDRTGSPSIGPLPLQPSPATAADSQAAP